MELRKGFVKIAMVVAVTVPLVGAAAPATFEVDGAHSKVLFKVRHRGISTVTGQFTQFDATIDVDPEDLSTLSAEATIDVASVDTEVERRDNHLRSADFFDVENHPQMEFVSTRAEVMGDNQVKLHGTLTLRGVTKPIVLDTTFGGVLAGDEGDRIGLMASTTINRRDFGVSYGGLLDSGVPVISDEVEIYIEFQATEATESDD